MREGTIHANGTEFAYLEAGSGPLVLLLHGFPDVAYTWEHQMAALADAGYRTVAPFLRGYPPTEVPDGGFYDPVTLANDVRALVEQLAGEPSFVVGQDWGAVMTARFAAASPELCRRAVTMAVPHPNAFGALLEQPSLIHFWFHFWFFQSPLADFAVAANDLAFIDYLWEHWSPGRDESAHLARVKASLSQPGALTASLDYYRAALGTIPGDPAFAGMAEAMARPITVPTMTIMGADDPALTMLEAQRPAFAGELRHEIVADAGHFVQREQPDEVNRLLLDWLGTALSSDA